MMIISSTFVQGIQYLMKEGVICLQIQKFLNNVIIQIFISLNYLMLPLEMKILILQDSNQKLQLD